MNGQANCLTIFFCGNNMPKFRFGRPLQSSLTKNAVWNRIELFDRKAVLYSLMIGLGAAVCIAFIWLCLVPHSLPLGSPSALQIGAALAALIIGHEVLHLLGFPRFGLSSDTTIGIWVELGSPYVQHHSLMIRNRFLFVAALPFAALSILPIPMQLLGIGAANYWSWVSVLNCIGAGSDIYIIFKTISTVPRKARVIEDGEALYWQQR
jgi:hypothetical protein